MPLLAQRDRASGAIFLSRLGCFISKMQELCCFCWVQSRECLVVVFVCYIPNRRRIFVAFCCPEQLETRSDAFNLVGVGVGVLALRSV